MLAHMMLTWLRVKTPQRLCAGIVFGAACTLSHMGAVLKKAVETLPPHQTQVFLAVLEQLRWFAGQQIRNVAVSSTSAKLGAVCSSGHLGEFVTLWFQAIGGNIMTASPISDLNPVFMAAGCRLTLMDKGKAFILKGVCLLTDRE